jgi:iron complex transport system substrate-binding protein
MTYRITLVAAIVMVFSASVAAHRRLDEPLRPEVAPLWQCRRIVSLAPGITETLYALGLGERLVGVSRHCEYPPEAKDKPRIGDCAAPNFEAILALKPDLVILPEQCEQALSGLDRLKLETLVVDQRTVEGLIESFRTIGRVCGVGPEGRRMAYRYENRLARIREKTSRLSRPRVLLAIDRLPGQGRLAEVCVVGNDAYLNRIIELAGGQNICQERDARYPVVSSEGILLLNPDVIVDLVPHSMLNQTDRQAIVADWDELATVDAVKRRNVLVLDRDYVLARGPRMIYLVEDLARKFHPEASPEADEIE